MFRPYWIISRHVKYIKAGQLYVIIVIDLWLEVSSVHLYTFYSPDGDPVGPKHVTVL